MRLGRGPVRMSREWAQVLSAAAGVTGFFLVTTVLVPELLIGEEVLPESWDAFTDLAVVFALGALLLRRPSVTNRDLNRSVVHGMLVALVIVAFAGAAAGVTALVHQGGLEVTLVAVVLVVMAALPLRAFVQWRTDAILFGGHGDPYRVITGLGRHLETTAPPDAVLPGVVDTVASALRLPYVAIELESATGPVIAASTGSLEGTPVQLPLTYQGDRVGSLVLSTRPGEHLTVADRKLLEDLARQIGVAARAVQLMRDLRRSHALLLAAREEERRRVRRDLHDGLGPMLAGIGLASQAARNLIADDPGAADAVLARVVIESRAATAEVRRLVYNLRPPALDRLGLVEALRERVLSLSPPSGGTGGDGLLVHIEDSGDLRTLPPAVEIAAYRIALEAFVNVTRHANARACTISLILDASLHISVIDDGDGIPSDRRPGVGIASMQERASELGGSCTVRSGRHGGTEVRALLPVAALDAL